MNYKSLFLVLFITQQVVAQVPVMGLTDDERNEILFYHNEARCEGSLTPVVWNYTLESVAQDWANLCTHTHNQNRDGDFATALGRAQPFPLYTVGENISWRLGGLVTKFQKMIQDERTSCGRGGGHYIQVMSRYTLEIGCGMYLCNQAYSGERYLVCNYFPGQDTGHDCPLGPAQTCEHTSVSPTPAPPVTSPPTKMPTPAITPPPTPPPTNAAQTPPPTPNPVPGTPPTPSVKTTVPPTPPTPAVGPTPAVTAPPVPSNPPSPSPDTVPTPRPNVLKPTAELTLPPTTSDEMGTDKDNDNEDDDGPLGGLLVPLIIGVSVCALLLVALLVFYCIYEHRSRQKLSMLAASLQSSAAFGGTYMQRMSAMRGSRHSSQGGAPRRRRMTNTSRRSDMRTSRTSLRHARNSYQLSAQLAPAYSPAYQQPPHSTSYNPLPSNAFSTSFPPQSTYAFPAPSSMSPPPPLIAPKRVPKPLPKAPVYDSVEELPSYKAGARLRCMYSSPTSDDPTDLRFNEGDIVILLHKPEPEDNWWTCEHSQTNRRGNVPKTYVELIA